MSHGRSVASVGLLPSVRNLLEVYFSVPSDLSRSGAQLFVLGAAVAALREVARAFVSFLDRTFVTRSLIDSRDEAFGWVTNYLGENNRDALHFTVSTNTRGSGSQGASSESSDDGGACPPGTNPITWLPAPGLHLLFRNGRPILVRRSLNGEAGQSNVLRPSERLERLELATLSTTPDVLHELIQHARSLFLRRDRSRTVVYTGTLYGGWQRLQARPIRPLDTVILPPEILNPLLSDVRAYLSRDTEIWYAERGVPYRRGYLFSGPPGTGKTSLAVGLAGEFKLGVYVVTLSNRAMTDDTLIELLGNMPRRSILLLEDIDVAFPNRAAAAAAAGHGDGHADTLATQNAATSAAPGTGTGGGAAISTGVTSSGLLNALDGVAAQEGRIVILTTNYPDRLDAALIRPGRVDMHVQFALSSTHDIIALFRNFFRDQIRGSGADLGASEESECGSDEGKWEEEGEKRDGEEGGGLAREFARRVESGRFSIAALQGYLMQYRNDPRSAIAHIEAWVAKN